MKRHWKTVCLAAAVAVVIIVAAVYLYDVLYLRTSFDKNLFWVLLTISILLGLIISLLFNGKSESLSIYDIYEKAYEKELGYAFQNNKRAKKRLLRACRFYNESKYRKALKHLFSLLKEIEFERDLIPVLLFIALCYDDAGVPGEAARAYLELLKHAPNNDQVHSNLGLLYAEQEDFEMAIQHYNKAVECNPYNYQAHVNRADYYFKLHEYDQAIADGEKALTIKNNGVEAAGLLTVIFALRQDEENKQKYYRIAVASGREPDDLDEAISYYLKAEKEAKV